MKFANLKHRITFQKFTSSTNSNGFLTETWADYKTVWAYASNLYGREFFQAMEVQAETTIKFVIRYVGDIDTDMRILFNSKQYNITFIDNVKYQNRFLEIKAIEVIE